MNYLKQVKDMVLFILLLWAVMLLGFYLIDILIVPLPQFIPQGNIYFLAILQFGITSALILAYLVVWDRLLAIYYKKNYEKRMKKE